MFSYHNVNTLRILCIYFYFRRQRIRLDTPETWWDQRFSNTTQLELCVDLVWILESRIFRIWPSPSPSVHSETITPAMETYNLKGNGLIRTDMDSHSSFSIIPCLTRRTGQINNFYISTEVEFKPMFSWLDFQLLKPLHQRDTFGWGQFKIVQNHAPVVSCS